MLTPELRRKVGELNFELKLEYLEEVLEELVDKILAKKEQLHKDTQPLLTIEEAATKFKVTKATIHNWKNRGLITGNKVGKNRYYAEEDIKALTRYGYSK